uniref:Uncharacterized protein n=1 Tax=Amphimedon queenslandica TaxID=400682 RepID=A0A1X7U1D1_AMPQE
MYVLMDQSTCLALHLLMLAVCVFALMARGVKCVLLIVHYWTMSLLVLPAIVLASLNM